jgi:multidrug efflux pump
MSRINLSEWALKHQQMIVFLLLLAAIAGLLAYGKLGQKEDPEFTIKTMVVQAYWPGSSAQQMAEQVTDKLDRLHQQLFQAG